MDDHTRDVQRWDESIELESTRDSHRYLDRLGSRLHARPPAAALGYLNTRIQDTLTEKSSNRVPLEGEQRCPICLLSPGRVRRKEKLDVCPCCMGFVWIGPQRINGWRGDPAGMEERQRLKEQYRKISDKLITDRSALKARKKRDKDRAVLEAEQAAAEARRKKTMWDQADPMFAELKPPKPRKSKPPLRSAS